MRKYRMKVGRANVALEFSKEKNSRLKSEILDILKAGYLSRIEEDFERYCTSGDYELAPLAG